MKVWHVSPIRCHRCLIRFFKFSFKISGRLVSRCWYSWILVWNCKSTLVKCVGLLRVIKGIICPRTKGWNRTLINNAKYTTTTFWPFWIIRFCIYILSLRPKLDIYDCSKLIVNRILQQILQEKFVLIIYTLMISRLTQTQCQLLIEEWQGKQNKHFI